MKWNQIGFQYRIDTCELVYSITHWHSGKGVQCRTIIPGSSSTIWPEFLSTLILRSLSLLLQPILHAERHVHRTTNGSVKAQFRYHLFPYLHTNPTLYTRKPFRRYNLSTLQSQSPRTPTYNRSFVNSLLTLLSLQLVPPEARAVYNALLPSPAHLRYKRSPQNHPQPPRVSLHFPCSVRAVSRAFLATVASCPCRPTGHRHTALRSSSTRRSQFHPQLNPKFRRQISTLPCHNATHSSLLTLLGTDHATHSTLVFFSRNYCEHCSCCCYCSSCLHLLLVWFRGQATPSSSQSLRFVSRQFSLPQVLTLDVFLRTITSYNTHTGVSAHPSSKPYQFFIASNSRFPLTTMYGPRRQWSPAHFKSEVEPRVDRECTWFIHGCPDYSPPLSELLPVCVL